MSLFEITGTEQVTAGAPFYRIAATKTIPHRGIKAGELGGLIERPEDVHDDAWVGPHSLLLAGATLAGEATMHGGLPHGAGVGLAVASGRGTVIDGTSHLGPGTNVTSGHITSTRLRSHASGELNVDGATITGSTITGVGDIGRGPTIEDSRIDAGFIGISGPHTITQGTLFLDRLILTGSLHLEGLTHHDPADAWALYGEHTRIASLDQVQRIPLGDAPRGAGRPVDGRTVYVTGTAAAPALALRYEHLTLPAAHGGGPEWEGFLGGLVSAGVADPAGKAWELLAEARALLS